MSPGDAEFIRGLVQPMVEEWLAFMRLWLAAAGIYTFAVLVLLACFGAFRTEPDDDWFWEEQDAD